MRTARARKQAAAQARVAKQDMWRVILALLIVVIAISTTFNAVTVALPKLFAERLADLTNSPALLGVIAACVYVFGAMTQYTIGKLLDRHSLKTVALPLSFVLAPFLYLAATLSNLPLILVSIGIVMGAFGQVTVNDAMVGKYTSEEWRSRAYAVRYFVGFTAAGASVGLVAWLYQQGGFVTMLHAFAGLCLLAIAAALILPREITVPAARGINLVPGGAVDASRLPRFYRLRDFELSTRALIGENAAYRVNKADNNKPGGRPFHVQSNFAACRGACARRPR